MAREKWGQKEERVGAQKPGDWVGKKGGDGESSVNARAEGE